MMKVAYNNCFGGFGLSEKALRMLANLKGIDLTGMEFEYSRFRNEDGQRSFGCPEDRTDNDLIKVIEVMGDEANGSCAILRIREIPDGAEFEIDDYDGNESVEPPRQSWS